MASSRYAFHAGIVPASALAVQCAIAYGSVVEVSERWRLSFSYAEGATACCKIKTAAGGLITLGSPAQTQVDSCSIERKDKVA